MFSFLTGGSASANQKEPNQELLKTQIRSALNKVCTHCNNYSVEELTFGQQVHPSLTCSKCELKAVGNEPSRLATNLITVPVFTENLARELGEYGANKLRPMNQEKANSEACAEISKKLSEQIEQTKETFKKLREATSAKTTELVAASEACNKVPVFERVAELQQAKKLDQVGNGQLLLKSSLVTDSLHFVDQAGLDESNGRINEHFNRINELTNIDLGGLNQLISFVSKVQI